MGLVVADDGWRIPDEVWAQMAPLLPERPAHPLGCHNPRVPDREVMNAILLVLRTGMQWNALSATGICSRSPSRPSSPSRREHCSADGTGRASHDRRLGGQVPTSHPTRSVPRSGHSGQCPSPRGAPTAHALPGAPGRSVASGRASSSAWSRACGTSSMTAPAERASSRRSGATGTSRSGSPPGVGARQGQSGERREVRRPEEHNPPRVCRQRKRGRRSRTRVGVPRVRGDERDRLRDGGRVAVVEQGIDRRRQLGGIGWVEQTRDDGCTNRVRPSHAASRTGSRRAPHVPGLGSKTPAQGTPHRAQRPSSRRHAPSRYQSRSTRSAPQAWQ